MFKFGFTERQADAIVTLQLYRLSNTDIKDLEAEFKNLELIIAALEAILNDENKLKTVMKEELRKIKSEYAIERKTQIKDTVEEIKIDTTEMITKEDCIVVVTNEGYVKRVSLRSYDKDTESLCKEGDYVIGKYKLNTMDTVLLFTDDGHYLYVPVHELPDLKWKELGKHISNIINIKADEKVISSFPIHDFNLPVYVTIFSKNGMVKRSLLNEFKVQRYSKPIVCMKLKEDDKVVSVDVGNNQNVFIITKGGYALRYMADEIPVVGLKTSGVKAINLKNDEVVNGIVYHNDMEYLTLITSKNTAKRVKLLEFELSSRAKRGVQAIREVKTNPYYIEKAFIVHYKSILNIKTIKEDLEIKLTEIAITDRYSTGSSIAKEKITDAYLSCNLLENNEKEEIEKENIDIDEIDKKMMTIDDFLDNLE